MKFSIPPFIKRDFWRKAVALFFAVLTWFAVNNRLQEHEIYRDLPVTLRYRSDKLILKQKVFTADITLRGSRHQLDRITTSDIHVSADIPVVPEGVYYYDLHLNAGNVNTPPGIGVARIEPRNIRIPLDRIITEEVPVRIQESGELPYGYQVVDRRAVPSHVSVSGASKVINEIDDLKTEPVVLDDTITDDFEIDKVRVLPISETTVNPEKVHVKYKIERRGGEKHFPEVSLRILSSSLFRIKNNDMLPAVSVTVKGTQSALKGITKDDIIPFLDLRQAEKPGSTQLPVHVWVTPEEDINASTVEPETISVDLLWRQDLLRPPYSLRFLPD